LVVRIPWLKADVETVAKRLLGCELWATLPGGVVRLRIVETEAYHQTDAASHSYKGKTPRTEVMFGPAGHVYVYFSYGMHYCMNIVTGETGEGSAVLIRAAEPLGGVGLLRANRPGIADAQLINGPAKLCKALGVDKTWNGHDLSKPPLKLIERPALKPDQVVQTTRIGISQAKDVPWRFYIKNSPFISKA
jgi:DNA-3-methyladenine glycosylase